MWIFEKIFADFCGFLRIFDKLYEDFWSDTPFELLYLFLAFSLPLPDFGVLPNNLGLTAISNEREYSPQSLLRIKNAQLKNRKNDRNLETIVW